MNNAHRLLTHTSHTHSTQRFYSSSRSSPLAAETFVKNVNNSVVFFSHLPYVTTTLQRKEKRSLRIYPIILAERPY